jgi:hypothetical protein
VAGGGACSGNRCCCWCWCWGWPRSTTHPCTLARVLLTEKESKLPAMPALLMLPVAALLMIPRTTTNTTTRV